MNRWCMFVLGESLHQPEIVANGQNSQPAITCSKLTIGTLEQGVKYVQS